jgi:hypothetical protein
MAARLHPDRVQAARQSMHHLVAKAPWSDAALLAAVCRLVLPAMARQQPIQRLQDVVILCGDGLTGLPDAARTVFPATDVQLCVVHQIVSVR